VGAPIDFCQQSIVDINSLRHDTEALPFMLCTSSLSTRISSSLKTSKVVFVWQNSRERVGGFVKSMENDPSVIPPHRSICILEFNLARESVNVIEGVLQGDRISHRKQRVDVYLKKVRTTSSIDE